MAIMDDSKVTVPTAPKALGRSSSRPTSSARTVVEAQATEQSMDNSEVEGLPSRQETDQNVHIVFLGIGLLSSLAELYLSLIHI